MFYGLKNRIKCSLVWKTNPLENSFFWEVDDSTYLCMPTYASGFLCVNTALPQLYVVSVEFYSIKCFLKLFGIKKTTILEFVEPVMTYLHLWTLGLLALMIIGLEQQIIELMQKKDYLTFRLSNVL